MMSLSRKARAAVFPNSGLVTSFALTGLAFGSYALQMNRQNNLLRDKPQYEARESCNESDATRQRAIGKRLPWDEKLRRKKQKQLEFEDTDRPFQRPISFHLHHRDS